MNRRWLQVIACIGLIGTLVWQQVPALLASMQPSSNLVKNSDIETGSYSHWFKDGNGIMAVESCCGQHQAFFWPSTTWGYGNDTWDAYIQPQGQYTALAQAISTVTPNKKYRLSAWLSTNGMTGYLRWYATSGGSRECAATAANFPAYPNVSCEFYAPTSTAGFNVHLAGNAAPGKWVLSDDWALTQLQPVPRIQGVSLLPLPVKYYARNYQNTVDRAATAWNSTVGQTVLTKAANESEAQVIVYAVDNGKDAPPGESIIPVTGKRWISLNIWYFSRWGSDPKVSTTAHELGHILGLEDMALASGTYPCQLMSGYVSAYWYCGIVQPTIGDKSQNVGDAGSLRNIYSLP